MSKDNRDKCHAALQRPRTIWQRACKGMARHRHALSIVVTLAVFAAALAVCWHLLHEVNPTLLKHAFYNVPITAVLGSVGAAVGSYVMLVCYEWSAARYAGVQLPWSALVMGGTCASAVGNAIGLSMLSGGAVRCRLYFKHGLSGPDVARMSVFVSLALGLALPMLAAIAALLAIDTASQALRLPSPMVVAIATSVLVFYLVMVLILIWRRQPQRPSVDSRLFDIGGWIWRLPGLRLSFLQLVITLLDVTCAATVLYLLLPNLPSFPTFLLIYLLALAAGVMSHVPGGIGVFEAIMLASFSGQVGVAPLTAALVLYRAIYVLLPLLLSCMALLINEGRRFISRLPDNQKSAGLAPPVLALILFFCGLVMLASNITPEYSIRLEQLIRWIPLETLEVAHFCAGLMGVLCLVLARGLRRRLTWAWHGSVMVLLASVICSLLKGLDWVQALVLAIVMIALILFRDAFYRQRPIRRYPLSGRYLLLCSVVVLASLWLMLFVYQDVPYHSRLWWQFALQADISRALRSVVGSILLIGAMIVLWKLKPAPRPLALPSHQMLERAWVIADESEQPEGALVLAGDKQLLFNVDFSAFIGYRHIGNYLVAFADPVGPAHDRAALLWDFKDLCEEHHLKPLVYQASAQEPGNYQDIGLVSIKIADEAFVELSGFNPESEHEKLHELWQRGRDSGLTFELYDKGRAPLDELARLSAKWLEHPRMSDEVRSSHGSFDSDYLRHFRVAVVRCHQRIVAFVNLLETQQGRHAALDLIRWNPDVSQESTEWLMVTLAEKLKLGGYKTLSLGSISEVPLKMGRMGTVALVLNATVFQRGFAQDHPDTRQVFMNYFEPQWRPRYLMLPPGVDATHVLADIAVSSAG